jgi:hypothetical protein
MYLECSANGPFGVFEVFELATRLTLTDQELPDVFSNIEVNESALILGLPISMECYGVWAFATLSTKRHGAQKVFRWGVFVTALRVTEIQSWLVATACGRGDPGQYNIGIAWEWNDEVDKLVVRSLFDSTVREEWDSWSAEYLGKSRLTPEEIHVIGTSTSVNLLTRSRKMRDKPP